MRKRRLENPWLKKTKESKCSYRPLSKDEIQRIDPHQYKPKKGGSKFDLSVCVGSDCEDRGGVVMHPKYQHYDDKGNKVREPKIDYEPIGINIDDPELQSSMKQSTSKYDSTCVIMEFRVMGFEPPPDEVVKSLHLALNSTTWFKGEKRTPRLEYEENGFSVTDGGHTLNLDIETRMSNLLTPIHSKRSTLKKLCGDYYAELSCVVYVVGDNVPALHLPKKIVKQLHELQAEMDLDLYFLPGDTEQEGVFY